MKRTALILATTVLWTIAAYPKTADAQTVNRACDTEGVTTSNSLICARTTTGKTKLAWKPITAPVVDPCTLFDNQPITMKAASKGITNPSQKVVRTYDNPDRRVCRIGDMENSPIIFATRKAAEVAIDLGGRRVSLLETDYVPVTAANGKTVYTRAENGRYYFWRELTPGIIIGLRVWYTNEPVEVETYRAYLIEQLAKP
jgi:hypothetical protein